MFWTRLLSGIVLLVIALATFSFGNIFLAVPLWLISLIAYRELTKALRCATDEKNFNALEWIGFVGVTAYYATLFFTRDQDIQTRIAELEEATKNNDGLHFQIAINYGGRDEIIRAVKKLSAKVQSGEVSPETITADMLEDYLDTAGIPDPDLLIRTCNEQRISNFLLWQLAYTEFYFTPVPWPDFTKEELMKAVEAYNHRDRRYGGLKEE